MNNLPVDRNPVEQDDASVKNEVEAGSSETVNLDSASTSRKPASSWLMTALRSFWKGLELRRIIFKVLTLLYALVIFGYAYFHMAAHRGVLSYMGIMLLMVIVYAEILVIRDHLWVIEGSMRESRRWRDIFFNQTTLRRQRIRKLLSILFATGVFSYMYFKAGSADKALLSFMGIMLLMTVLYYEILTIRDEIFIIGQSLQPESEEEAAKRRQNYDKFIKQEDIEPEKTSEQPPEDATPKQS